MADRRSIAADALGKSKSNCELLLAASEGNAIKVKKLIEDGADINFQDDYGDTCLHWAADNNTNNYDVIEAIVNDSSLNIIVENCKGETALDMAGKTRNKDERPSEIIIRKIHKEAENIHRNFEKHDCKDRASSKVDEPVQNRTFFDATASGDYDRLYSKEDLKNILTFWCAPCKEDLRHMENGVTFQLDGHGEISIFQKKGLSWSWTTATQAKWFRPDYDNTRSDVVTQVLLEIREVCKKLERISFEEDYEKAIQECIDKSKHVNPEKGNKRHIFANILREMERTNNKIRYCLKALNSANKTTFSYREANMFNYFIETFALEDTFPEIQLSDPEEHCLKMQKKEYYKRFYPGIQDTFAKYRVQLFKVDKHKSLQPDTIKDFIVTHLGYGTLKEFYGILIKFCEFVENACEPNENTSDPQEPLHTFSQNLKRNFKKFLPSCKETKNKNENAEDSTLSDIFQLYLPSWANWNDPNIRQKAIFDLAVNLWPKVETFSRKQEAKIPNRLCKLRNGIVHKFHDISAEDLIEDFHVFKHDLYRYELALKVHTVLSTLRERSSSEIEKGLTEALKEQNEHCFYNVGCTKNASDAERIAWYDSSWMTENRQIIVQIYVNYLAPFSNNYDDKGLLGMSSELNTQQKRKLLEHIWCFRRLSRKSESRETLKQFVEENLLAVNADNYVDFVLKSWPKKNQGHVTELLMILKNLDGLARATKLSQHVITSYYEAFLKGKFNGNQISFENYSKIVKTFRSFPNNEMREVVFRYLKKTAVPVKVGDFVLSLGKMFYEPKNVSHLKMDTIKSLFSDDTFLSYLVKLDHETSRDEKVVLKNPYLTYRVVQELTELKYTSYYVLKLLVMSADLRVITKSSLKDVLINCLEEYAEIFYLNKLVVLEVDRVKCALLEVLQESFIHKQKYILFRSVVRILLEAKAECVQSINEPETEKVLREDRDRILLEAKAKCVQSIYEADKEIVLCAASKNLQDLVWLKKLDDASNLIKRVDELRTNEINEEWSLSKAEFYHALGISMSSKNAVREKFQEALECLKVVSKEKSQDNYMLALARAASSHRHLLQDCSKRITIKESQKIQERYELLLQEIWEYITENNSKRPDFAEFHKRAKSSDRYQDLLAVSEKHRHYFNICRVMLRAISFYGKGTRKPDRFERNLKMIDEIYNVYRKEVRQDTSAICNVCRKDLLWQDISNLMLCMKFKIDIHTKLAANPSADQAYHRMKKLELIVLRLQREKDYYGQVEKSSRQDLCDMFEYLRIRQGILRGHGILSFRYGIFRHVGRDSVLAVFVVIVIILFIGFNHIAIF